DRAIILTSNSLSHYRYILSTFEFNFFKHLLHCNCKDQLNENSILSCCFSTIFSSYNYIPSLVH
ncbi:hypothetical protein Leryth_021480, partial [Lithospermum erythrorhizon]